MKTKLLSIICSSLLLAVSSTQATAVAQGAEEIRVNGGIELNTEVGTKVTLELGYGVFVADYFEAGVIGGYRDDDIVTDFFGGLFAEYNFETGTELVPFAGGQLSLHHADIDLIVVEDAVTAVVFGIYAGAKYFLTESVAVSGRLLLEAATDDVFIDEGEPTDNNLTVDLGLNFFF